MISLFLWSDAVHVDGRTTLNQRWINDNSTLKQRRLHSGRPLYTVTVLCCPRKIADFHKHVQIFCLCYRGRVPACVYHAAYISLALLLQLTSYARRTLVVSVNPWRRVLPVSWCCPGGASDICRSRPDRIHKSSLVAVSFVVCANREQYKYRYVCIVRRDMSFSRCIFQVYISCAIVSFFAWVDHYNLCFIIAHRLFSYLLCKIDLSARSYMS